MIFIWSIKVIALSLHSKTNPSDAPQEGKGKGEGTEVKGFHEEFLRLDSLTCWDTIEDEDGKIGEPNCRDPIEAVNAKAGVNYSHES